MAGPEAKAEARKRGAIRAVSQKGLTIVPLRLYIRNHVAKVELGLARGRRQYDKRKAIARKEAAREVQRFTKATLTRR